MSIRQFIGASSGLLLVWLGITFFHEIPANRYQHKVSDFVELDKGVTKNEDTIVSFTGSDN